MLKRMFIAVVLITGLAGFSSTRAFGEPASPAAREREAWQKEFDEICSRTQDAMSLSQEELATLIQRADALLPQIEKLDETRKKVYMGRLRMCRGLYEYVLESKKNEKK